MNVKYECMFTLRRGFSPRNTGVLKSLPNRLRIVDLERFGKEMYKESVGLIFVGIYISHPKNPYLRDV